MNPRTLLALARGVTPGAGCRCQVCGPSLFDAGGQLGDNFTDLDLLEDPGAPGLCIGCSTLLAGRPGDDPPPLRMTSIRATQSGLEVIDRATLWGSLLVPLYQPHVLSWAVGGKRHHWLRAGVSTQARLLIGTDEGTVEYVPARDRWLLDAVHALLASPTGTAPLLSRESIRTGHYHPAATVKYGAAEWTRIEAMVAQCRPSPLLDMAVALAPISGPPPSVEEDSLMIDPQDEIAADLLAQIASASDVRSQDGMMFWGGYFRHRLERYRRLPLAGCVSRLLDACRCSATAPGTKNAVNQLEAFTSGETADVERSLRERPALVLSVAYARLKAAREGGAS